MCRARQSASWPDAASRCAANSRSESSSRYRVPAEPSGPSRSTTDLSTRLMSTCSTRSRGTMSQAPTSSAAATSKFPAKTDSRSHSARSAGVHRL